MSEQRREFRRLTAHWHSAFPDSAEAVEAVALALELLDDENAADTLRLARALVPGSATKSRIAANEVWLRLKYSIPWNPNAVRAARLLADSVLRANPPGRVRNGRPFSGLALLLGRVSLAAAYERTDDVIGQAAIPAIARSAPPLLAFAAAGGPADSLRLYERLLQAGIERLASADRFTARNSWLLRAASIAFPVDTFAVFSERIGPNEDYMIRTQADLLRGDTAAVRQELWNRRALRQRSGILPVDRTFDTLLPEASLLLALGDTAGAIDWLDPSLLGLARTAPRVFTDPPNAGGLLRAIVLRARLAAAIGDRETARRWAVVARELLEDPDPFLRPLAAEMRGIAR